MKQNYKTTIFKVFLVIFILCVFQMQGMGRIIMNTSEIAFEEPGSTGIRQYVIEAAGDFLNSQSNFLLFLNKIEMEELNGVEYAELQQVINNTVVHMENARTKYKGLTQLANNTPYDQTKNAELMVFNYTSFQENKGLKGVIFNDVEAYLISGDVRGLYQQILGDTQSILDQLNVIKSAVDAEVIPNNSDLWQVNQSYSATLLSGQYAAEVFYDLNGK